MNELTDFLASYIENINHCNSKLDEEEKQLKERLKAIETERTQLRERLNRARNYPINLDIANPHICEVCFLEHGLSIDLTPIPGDDFTDKFRCSHCDNLLEITID